MRIAISTGGGDAPGLNAVIRSAVLSAINRGRAFYATPERLGEYVLVDFVGRRSKRVS